MEMIKVTESWIVDDVSFSGYESADLSSWEIINPSDDDDDGTLGFSLSSSDDDDAVSINEFPPSKKPKSRILLDQLGYNYYSYSNRYPWDGCHVGGEDEYESEDDGLDDELVPKSVGGRLERNRMRKLGKREFSKMAKSKKLPFNRPGCVHGKHGLGLKHSLI